jgi:hypothetical protein
VKKSDLAPWPAPGAARGPLAWSDDELAGVIRDNGIAFPVLTPEAEAEAQRENKFLEALESGVVREAFESGAIGRKKPGRRPGTSRKRDAYRLLAQACLDEAAGRSKKAEQDFIKIACAQARITPERAKNCWYEATEPDGLTRRARR